MIPWLYDIFNVCVPPAGVNHNQSLGLQGLPGRPGFSPKKPTLRAAGQAWYEARRPGLKTSGPARPGPFRTLGMCIQRLIYHLKLGVNRSNQTFRFPLHDSFQCLDYSITQTTSLARNWNLCTTEHTLRLSRYHWVTQHFESHFGQIFPLSIHSLIQLIG
jgi:hypothetical protein